MKRLFSGLRLRLVLLVSLAVLPALGLILYSGLDERRQAGESVRADAMRLVRLITVSQSQLIQYGNQLLVTLSNVPQVRESDLSSSESAQMACSTLLAGLAKQYPYFVNIGVAQPNGDQLCTAIPSNGPLNYADRTWLQQALQTRHFVVGDYTIGKITHTGVLPLAYPILDSDGQVTRVVFVGIDLKWFTQYAGNIQLPEGTVLTVIDHNGTILASSLEPEKWVGQTLTDAPFVNTILTLKEGTTEAVGLDGIVRLYAFSPLNNPQGGNTYTSLGIPAKVAYAQSDSKLAFNLLALLAAAILALAVAWGFGNPLILRSSVDEIIHNQQLLQAFNKVTQAIQRAHAPEDILLDVSHEMNQIGFSAAILRLSEDKHSLDIPYLGYESRLLNELEKLSGVPAKNYRFPVVPGGYFQRILAEGKTTFTAPFTEAVAEAVPERVRPLADQITRLLGIKQGIVAPLAVNGDAFGLLVVTGSSLREADLTPLNTFANQIAIALENVRLYQETQHRAEAILQSEQKYRSLTEGLNEVVYRADPHTFATTYVNAAVERVYGYSAEEWLADPGIWKNCVHPDDRQRVFAQVAGVELKMEDATIDYRIIRKDKTVRWVEDHVSWEKDPQHNVVSMKGLLYDITERKQADEALRESEARFRAIFEQAAVGVTLTNSQTGRNIRTNQKTCEIVGYSCEELEQMTFQAITHPDDLQADLENMQKLLTGEIRTFASEKRYCRKDGSMVWVYITVSPLWAEGEKPDYHIAVIEDITERKRAEEALRESQERYRRLFEYSPISLWEEDVSEVQACLGDLRGRGVTDFEAYFAAHSEAAAKCMRLIRVLDVNEATLQLYGAQSKSELLSRLDRVIGPVTEPIVRRELAALARGERKFEAEGSNHRLTGERLDVDLRWVIPPGQASAPSRVLVSIGDITERKQAEKALRESEVRFRAIFEQAAVGVMLTNSQTGEFISTNQKTSEILGYSREELEKTTFQAITHPDDLPADLRNMQKLLAGEIRTFAHEKRYCRKDGSAVWVYVTISPLWAEGEKPDYHIVVVEDITERKQAEDALRQLNADLEQRVAARTAELTEANAALKRAAQLKDEFLATMSHELRTPLTAVQGLSESLQMGIYGSLAEEQLTVLGTIRESGRHLLDLITDVLDFSRIEAGQLEMRLEPVVVEDVCESSLRAIWQLAQKKKLRVSTVYDPQAGIVRADGQRLKQMLVNLLTNAVKFTPAGGEIGLKVEGDLARQVVRFAVWDTGIGVAPENQPRLFRPFTQLDSRLARDYEGTGLGLSLVQRIAELHGGEVTMESDGVPGHGSRFTLTLPWRLAEEGLEPIVPFNQETEVPPTPFPAEPEAETRPAAAKLLLVEDNEAILLAVSNLLQTQGYEVHAAGNGDEAIAQTWTVRPDAILLDIQLPGMDGWEVMRRLRAAPEFAATPIVALTALAMPGDRERCLEAGATDYLSKPLHFRRLLQLVQQLLDRRA